MIKKILYSAIAVLFIATVSLSAEAERLVILHTNDTHSQIDPTKNDTGGILRRKVLIDSIRRVEPEVLLVDAGDAWQGSLFFTLFDGEVEQNMLNALGYDIQILGNHEFDNGLERLAEQYRRARPTLLSTNYEFTSTPLDSMFATYVVRPVGDKKVGIIGLNINPEGLIDRNNYEGLVYNDVIERANATAWYLKNILEVDKVVALTHIGYENDKELARNSRNIDIIIGGHSHTLLNPALGNLPHMFENLDGHVVLIAQLNKSGENLGQIDIDFDNNSITSKVIPVNSRLDRSITPAELALIAPYRQKVDSIKAIEIGMAAMEFPQNSWQLRNLLSDFVADEGARLAGSPIDFGLINIGGIRNSIPKGTVTQGHIIEMLPFNNRIVVIDVKGSDILELLDLWGEQAFSSSVSGKREPGTIKASQFLVNGKKIKADEIYRIATIDYLANGGDSMKELTNGHIVARSPRLLYRDVIDAFVNGIYKDKAITADTRPRIRQE